MSDLLPIGTSLAAFVPWDRRLAISTGQELSDRTAGAALYVDISGFTAFSNQAVEQWGPRRAAEEVSALVNNLCDHVIGQVHNYGGTVIGFAGDGITSWFDGDRGRRAAAAALSIAKAAEQLTTVEAVATGGMPPVTTVITAGLARRFVVGDPTIQSVDVLAGGILDRLATAEEIAQPGEVLVGGEIVGWLGADVEIVAWRADDATGENFAVIEGDLSGITEPEPAPDTQLEDTVAEDWVLPPLLQRHATVGGLIESEIRPACSVFLSFRGFDYDFDNDVGDKLDQFIQWVQGVFARHGGYVLQIIVGDKGSYLYGAFGAPLAHEDDALRALRTGEQLLHPPDELGYVTDLQVGVDIGPVLAGTYGGHNRLTYGILGQTVNNAARLMSAAQPGHMLATQEVIEAAPAKVTGTDTRVAALADRAVVDINDVRPLRGIERVEVSRPGELIGREEEQGMIATELRRLLSGETRAVYVKGDGGMGTSVLLADLRKQAIRLGVTVLVGAGDAIEQETPFFAFRSVFTELIGLDDAADENTIAQRIVERLGAGVEPRLPLLNPLLSVPVPETELTATMPPDARRDQTFEILIDAFADGAERLNERVIIIDDAQWLDDASLTLLENLATRVDGVFLAIGARTDISDPDGDEPTDPAIESIVERTHGVVVDLAPLPSADIVRIVAATLEADELPPELASVVADRAMGNPYFAQELARTLVTKGLVRVDQRRCQLTASADDIAQALPEQLQSGLVARIDSLTPDQQLVVRASALLGAGFDEDLLIAATGPDLDTATLERAVGVLVEEGILEPNEEGGVAGHGYRFGSSLVQDAAAGLLPTERKRMVHSRAAHHLEDRGAGVRADQFPTLAYHWQGAGETLRSAGYWAKAGDGARASSFDGNAVNFYRRALESVGDLAVDLDPLERARWEVRLGESYVQHQGSDSAEGRRWLEQGLRRFGQPVRAKSWVAGVAVIPQLLRQWWWRMRGPRSDSPPDRELLLEASRAYERLVEVYFLAGDTARALEASVRTLNLAEKAGPSPELARETATFGALLGFVPMPKLAEKYLERALATVDDTDDRSAMAWVPMVASFYHAGRADWDNADRLAHRTLQLAEDSGDLRRYEDALSNLMMQAYLRGDIGTGLKRADELAGRATERGAELSRAYALQGRAYCLLDSGRINDADATITELLDIFGEADQRLDEGLMVDTRAQLALAKARAGAFEDARPVADEALRFGRKETPSNFSGIATYAAPAETYIRIARAAGLDRDLDQAIKRSLKVLKKYTNRFPVGLPRLHFLTGVYASLRNKPNQAGRHLAEAVDVARRLGMRLEEARALLELAKVTKDPSAESQHRAEGQTILDELGIDPYTADATL